MTSKDDLIPQEVREAFDPAAKSLFAWGTIGGDEPTVVVHGSPTLISNVATIAKTYNDTMPADLYWRMVHHANCSPSSLSDLDWISARRSILPRIGSSIEPEFIAAIEYRWRGGVQAPPHCWSAALESAQPRLSAYILLMFHAMVTRLHSPRTQSNPRTRNWRNPKIGRAHV